jgi:hypothetical protein
MGSREGRRVAGRTSGRAWLTAGIFALALAAPGARAADTIPAAGRAKETSATSEKPCDASKRPQVDDRNVYFGRACASAAPATVDADKLFRSIPEYKRILNGRLTERDPKYSVYMLRATRKFRAAVAKAAGDGAYDLVAAAGTVTWDGGAVPDITETALARLDEAEKARR